MARNRAVRQERKNGVFKETKKQVVEVKIYRNVDLALPVA